MTYTYDFASAVDEIELAVVLVFILEVDGPISLVRAPFDTSDFRKRVRILFVRTHCDSHRGLFRDPARNKRIVGRFAAGQKKYCNNWKCPVTHQGHRRTFSQDFQLEIGGITAETRLCMSIRASLNDSIAAIRSIFELEDQVTRAADLLRETLLSGHKVLACGNGGSASDSAHLATELACRFVGDRRPYPAISLTGDGGLLTATGNDYSFAELFARQVIAFGSSGDLLVVLTTSGNSENVKRALQQAKESGLKSISLLGRDGGACRGLADVELLVPEQETARIQEAHKVIIHLICELVEPSLSKQ